MTTRFYQLAILLGLTCFAAPVFGFLPEGNVNVMQSGGSLFITGDDTANGIQIGQFYNGDFFVMGFDCNGGETSLNYGNDDDYLVFSGVHNIFINTKRGDDCVAATNDLWGLANCLGFDDIPDTGPVDSSEYDLADVIYLPGNLVINSSGGWDAVGIGWFETGGTMEVRAGYGHDLVGVCHVRTGNNLNIFAHNGEDDVLITGEPFYGGKNEEMFANEIGRTLLINLGRHDDNLCVERLRTENGSIIVDARDGHDNVFIGDCLEDHQGPPEGGTGGNFASVQSGLDLVINTNNGDDDVGVFRTDVYGSMILNAGQGYDDVFVDECYVDRSAIINSGNESDYVQISYLETNLDLILNTVGGDDYVDLYYLYVGRNFVSSLGTGDDHMYIDDMSVMNLFQVGAGNDNDYVDAYYVYCNLLYTFMNAGDDEFSLRDSTATRLLTIGGAGYDCFNDDYNSFDVETILSYEEFDCDDYDED